MTTSIAKVFAHISKRNKAPIQCLIQLSKLNEGFTEKLDKNWPRIIVFPKRYGKLICEHSRNQIIGTETILIKPSAEEQRFFRKLPKRVQNLTCGQRSF